MNERSIVNLNETERQAIADFIERLNDRFPEEVLEVTLFGSKARGDSSPWSDIDILIKVKEESWSLRGEISIVAADISLEYDVLIGPRVIGLERWDRMKRDGFSLYHNIIAEGIPLAPATMSS